MAFIDLFKSHLFCCISVNMKSIKILGKTFFLFKNKMVVVMMMMMMMMMMMIKSEDKNGLKKVLRTLNSPVIEY